MVSPMSGITLAQAQQVLDALVAAQIEDPSGSLGSITVNGRTVTYRSAEDVIKLIEYWRGIVAHKTRLARGTAGIGIKRASFRTFS
jgi:hypothetical protein